MYMGYQKRTRKILKECGAFIEGGHFICSSGRHSDFYVNKDALYAYPKKLDDVCYMMSQKVMETYADFDVVLAPAVAGIVLGQNIAYNLSMDMNKNLKFAYADKRQLPIAKRVIRRGYQNFIKGKNVLLVDDVVSTGSTLISMAEEVSRLGGCSVGAVVICNRGGVQTLSYQYEKETIPSQISISPLVELDLQTFPKDNCPLCKAGRPLETSIGEATISDLVSRV